MEAAPSGPFAERSVEDVLAGRLRIRLAGEWHTLPVLTIGQNADWLASLDAELAPLMEGDDDLDVVVGKMEALNARLLDFVYSYDRMGLLPDKATIERDVYPHEVLRAVMEVRLAANPTLGFALAGAMAEMRSPSPAPSQPTSSPRRRTAGSRARSGKS
jgi:hypothetical protein